MNFYPALSVLQYLIQQQSQALSRLFQRIFIQLRKVHLNQQPVHQIQHSHSLHSLIKKSQHQQHIQLKALHFRRRRLVHQSHQQIISRLQLLNLKQLHKLVKLRLIRITPQTVKHRRHLLLIL